MPLRARCHGLAERVEDQCLQVFVHSRIIAGANTERSEVGIRLDKKSKNVISALFEIGIKVRWKSCLPRSVLYCLRLDSFHKRSDQVTYR